MGIIPQNLWLPLIAVLVALGLVLPVSAAGSDAGAAAALWHGLTTLDVQAAYSLLERDHPATAPEAGDPKFGAVLRAAYARALTRAAQVSSYDGYIATLGELANSMGDGHIWSYSTHVPREVRWAGIIAALHGRSWVVAVDDPQVTGSELKGARLVECDGRPVDSLAREVLHYMTDVNVEAMLALRAPWLLIDQGNPFLAPPKACTFERAGRTVTLSLHWQRISRSELIQHHWYRPYGQAGFGVRSSGRGYWVAIQELGAAAQAVVDAVASQAARIQAAPYVVVDVRGNGGGDDHYMRVLAEELYGKAHVDAILGPYDTPGCPEVYRASADNIAALAAEAQVYRSEGDLYGANAYFRAVKQMRAAMAAGRTLTGPATCPAGKAAGRSVPPSRLRGRVFLLTDVACFSSCINGVELFRRLGATQIGQVTGADTHYFEVREIVLPSGLATFSTLQALSPHDPAVIGPFKPTIEYDGDMADTASLERWVSKLAGSPRLGATAVDHPRRP